MPGHLRELLVEVCGGVPGEQRGLHGHSGRHPGGQLGIHHPAPQPAEAMPQVEGLVDAPIDALDTLVPQRRDLRRCELGHLGRAVGATGNHPIPVQHPSGGRGEARFDVSGDVGVMGEQRQLTRLPPPLPAANLAELGQRRRPIEIVNITRIEHDQPPAGIRSYVRLYRHRGPGSADSLGYSPEFFGHSGVPTWWHPGRRAPYPSLRAAGAIVRNVVEA